MSDLISRYQVSDIERMGQAIAASGLFGMKTPAQAIALMLIAQAEGQHPALAARDYDIIQGRPALKAKAKLARFQKSGGKFEWVTRTDTECSASFSHPACPKPVTISWDMEMAKEAGLGGKDTWKKYPRQMLSARVISEGVDATFPDAGGMMYVPEEVADFEPLPNTRKPPKTNRKAHSMPQKKKDNTIDGQWDKFLLSTGYEGDNKVLANLFVGDYCKKNHKELDKMRMWAIGDPSGFEALYDDFIEELSQLK